MTTHRAPPSTVALPARSPSSPEEMLERAQSFASLLQLRRTVRSFSPQPVDRQVLLECLRAAGTAPSGANQQPWHFVLIENPALKHQLRVAAEAEETAFYHGRASERWLEALQPFGTDEHKPFLEVAPYLIAVFAQRYGRKADGSREQHYYVTESVGIAVGMLITALHQAGLCVLTHTPSPMGFLNGLCARPDNEKPFLLLVVGQAAHDARVPDIQRKPLDEFVTVK